MQIQTYNYDFDYKMSTYATDSTVHIYMSEFAFIILFNCSYILLVVKWRQISCAMSNYYRDWESVQLVFSGIALPLSQHDTDIDW
jgi:uncharacterized membrane protein YagU involved in acid resistance